MNETNKTNDRIQRDYEKWRETSTEAYEVVRRFAYDVLASQERFGIAAIWERARWYVYIERKGERWKFNNNHKSRVVRDLIAEDPNFATLFEIRRLRCEKEVCDG
jgi:hypothetical protein